MLLGGGCGNSRTFTIEVVGDAEGVDADGVLRDGVSVRCGRTTARASAVCCAAFEFSVNALRIVLNRESVSDRGRLRRDRKRATGLRGVVLSGLGGSSVWGVDSGSIKRFISRLSISESSAGGEGERTILGF